MDTAAVFGLPSAEHSVGIPYSKGLKSNSLLRVDHELIVARGAMARKNVVALSDIEIKKVLQGGDIDCDASLDGDVVLLWDDMPIGLGLAKNGRLKNRLSRWIIQQEATW